MESKRLEARGEWPFGAVNGCTLVTGRQPLAIRYLAVSQREFILNPGFFGQVLKAKCQRLVLVRFPFFLPPQNALVDRLPAFEAFFLAMPVLDLLFAQPPAEQYDLVFHGTREIEQAN